MKFTCWKQKRESDKLRQYHGERIPQKQLFEGPHIIHISHKEPWASQTCVSHKQSVCVAFRWVYPAALFLFSFMTTEVALLFVYADKGLPISPASSTLLSPQTLSLSQGDSPSCVNSLFNGRMFLCSCPRPRSTIVLLRIRGEM